MQSQDGKVNIALWVVIAVCATFLALWVFGVRVSSPEPISVQRVDEPEDEDAEPMPRREHAKSPDDEVLPQERVVIDDGRDPDAPLL
jgi:hypothetical protein